MKRMHLHVLADDLGKSIAFYSTLSGTAPSVEKTIQLISRKGKSDDKNTSGC